MTSPVPAHGIVARSMSEHKSGLIAWDKERKTRKFGDEIEWKIDKVVFESVPVKVKSNRGRKPRKSLVETIELPKVTIPACVSDKGPELAIDRDARKIRMMTKLLKLREV